MCRLYYCPTLCCFWNLNCLPPCLTEYSTSCKLPCSRCSIALHCKLLLVVSCRPAFFHAYRLLCLWNTLGCIYSLAMCRNDMYDVCNVMKQQTIKESNSNYTLAYWENHGHITAYLLRNLGFSLAVRSMQYDSRKPQVVVFVKAGSNEEVKKTLNSDGPKTLYDLTTLLTRRYLIWVTACACFICPVCKRNPAVDMHMCKLRRGVVGRLTCCQL